MNPRLKLFFLIVAAGMLFSCSTYQKALRTTDPTKKFQLALKYYNKKDFARATPLLEELLNTYRGTDSSEIVYYYYCYTQFYSGDYDMAAFHFRSYNETFYNGRHMEECAYMYAHSLYKAALPSYLDPTSSKKAITELQLFLNLYPGSTYLEACTQEIDNLRRRLEKKAVEIAMLYYRTMHYKAAITSFRNVLKDYPDISNKEEIELLIIRSDFELAQNSIDSRKEERYRQGLADLEEFYTDFREGTQLRKDADDLRKRINKELEKIKNNL